MKGGYVAAPQVGSNDNSAPTSIELMPAHVSANKDRWAALPVADKLKFLGEMLEIFRGLDHEAWARDALEATGFEKVKPEPLLAAEMILNTKIIGTDLEVLADVLATIKETGKPPQVPVRTEQGKVIADVFPRTMPEKGGRESNWKVEVWMQGSEATQGMTYGGSASKGRLCLLLSAGNQGILGVCDILYLLFVEGMVCIVKHNPVRAYNHAWVEKLFAPLIREGFVASLVGGVEESQALLRNPCVDHVHMTGGKATHDAIVWGGTQRKEKVLSKPITSELGAVTPYIIGPGQWTDEELDHHARYFTTVLMQNNSCNCNAPQVLLLPDTDFPRQKFLAMVKTMVKKRPHNPPYYPGTKARHQAWIDGLEGKAETELLVSEVQLPPGRFGPPLPWAFSEVDFHKLSSGELPIVSSIEAFGPMLAISVVPGKALVAQDSALKEGECFWRNVVTFCNEKLLGSLSCVVVRHPSNLQDMPEVNADVVRDLKYGSVGLNSWGGQSFGFTAGTWGAYPGERLEAVESGIGCVRNYLLFEDVEKTVVRAPFITPVHIGTAPQPPALAEAKMLCSILANDSHTDRHNKDNGYVAGNFRPIEAVGQHTKLEVEGTIPQELVGCFMRGGTNQRFAPHGKMHMFDGDAMLHTFMFSEGSCTSYANAYLETPRFLANQAAGKELYPHIGDIAHGGLEVAKKLGYLALQQRTGMVPAVPNNRVPSPATNTALIGGKLYACVEVACPFRIFINPKTGVVTSGVHDDWNGKVPIFSAHSKTDPKTQDVSFFTAPPVRGGPMCSYGVFGKDGTLKKSIPFQAGSPPPAFLHDHFLTPNFAICVDHSIRGDTSKLVSSGYFNFDPKHTLRLGVLPRDANDADALEWYDTGKPGYVWHCVAAFEEGNKLILWLPIFSEYPGGLPLHLPEEPDSYLHKIVLNRETKTVESFTKFEEIGVTERCGINEQYVASPDLRFAYLMLRGEEEMYQGFVKFDLREEKVVGKVDYGPTSFGGEAYFVPKPGGKDEDDGWLMDIVYDKASESSDLRMWDAKSIGPSSNDAIARVKLPHRIPYGVHANFLSPSELEIQWADSPTA
eukprot:TRINITY_DN21398_c0_g3_i1.p1 TRINITY_DN21398_c0_g3~~TRINITY_DN21398_c0_g3_i1.p1  ORF type:complete len:1077 (+),score=141.89 TRINITY_DN21398_c0_g3_i1:62-3292(+)